MVKWVEIMYDKHDFEAVVNFRTIINSYHHITSFRINKCDGIYISAVYVRVLD